MKYESILNIPGGESRVDESTRIVGFRVSVSEITKLHEPCEVINPKLVTELAIQYLINNGYEVTKK